MEYLFNILPAGFVVENLAETYVIFITENDVIGKNQPIYHIERYIREAEQYFDDGSYIIYVNASYKDDTELGKLMHDFSVIEPEDMNLRCLLMRQAIIKRIRRAYRLCVK